MSLSNGAVFDLVIGLPLMAAGLIAITIAYAKRAWPFKDIDE